MKLSPCCVKVFKKIPDPHLYQALSQALQKQENGLVQAITWLLRAQTTPDREAYLALSSRDDVQKVKVK